MPPSKTVWPSLNVVIFPPVMRLVLDDPKFDNMIDYQLAWNKYNIVDLTL